MARMVCPFSTLTSRLWADLTVAIKNADMNAANAAKTAVEDRQRALRQERAESGAPAPTSRFFVPVGEKWMPKLDVDKLPKDVDELEAAVRNFIFGNLVPGPPPPGSEPSTSSAPAQSIEVPPVDAAPTGRGAPAPAAPGAAPGGPIGSGAGGAPMPAAAGGAPRPAGNGAAVPIAAGVSAGVGAGAAAATVVGTGGPMPAAGATGVPMGAEVISGVPAGSQMDNDNRRTSVASSVSDDEFHDAQEEHY